MLLIFQEIEEIEMMGNHPEMSEVDIRKINSMYQCNI